jgi:hypothetical protein
MKKSRIICVLVVLVAALGSTAKAVPVNPIEWHFSVTTYGAPSSWFSNTNIIPTYPQYNYEWQLTKMEVNISSFWNDVTSLIPLNEREGSGTFGQLPCEDEKFMRITISAVYADLLLDVDSQGYGKVRVDNISMIVDGARFEGDVMVNGVPVPEPAVVSLLALGSLALLRKRRECNRHLDFTRKKHRFLGGYRSK